MLGFVLLVAVNGAIPQLADRTFVFGVVVVADAAFDGHIERRIVYALFPDYCLRCICIGRLISNDAPTFISLAPRRSRTLRKAAT